MGTRPRTFLAQQYQGGTEVFFPRSNTRELSRAAAAPTYRGAVESNFGAFGAERKRDYSNSREMDRTSDKRGSGRYDRNEAVGRNDSRDVGRGAMEANGQASDSNGNRYRYLDEGWYSAYKPQPPTNATSNYFSDSVRERDYRGTGNGYETQPSSRAAPDRYRYGKGAESARGTGIDTGPYSVVNSEIVMETRQLEERVAAIQRELEMLEKDDGSRSSDYRSSRSAYHANSSGHLPSLLDFAPPPNAVEKARFEREEVTLRMREQDLRRREQELIYAQQRAIRERARERPAPSIQYGRVAPPSRPKNATFPKQRSSFGRRPATSKRTSGVSSRKQLPERRRTLRTQEKTKKEVKEKAKKEVKLPAKQKRVEKREVKEENDSKKKRTSGAEASPKKSDHNRTTDGMIEQILGKYRRARGDSPRSRSLKQLLEFCDVSLLGDEIREKAGTFISKPEEPAQDDYKTRTCIRTYNPTVLGPLDQYVPLGLFEEEVKMDVSTDKNAPDKVLEVLQATLSDAPRSPVA